MKASLSRILIIISLLIFVGIWTAGAQERGDGRKYGTGKDSSSSSSVNSERSSSSGESDSRGDGRFSGKDRANETADADDDSDIDDATRDIEDLTGDHYNFAFEWKWNKNEREIACEIPVAYIAESEKELEKISGSKDPYKALGIDWKRYAESKRNHVFWQALYRYLFSKNLDRISVLTAKFKEIKTKEKLSDAKLLELVLTFVQNIPYKRPGGDLDVLTQPNSLYKKFGDCDTKSLLLTTILSGLGYDTVIFYSSYYSHAMAGIYMNGSGTFVKHSGKKYYFLETTYPGWKAGVLPPEYKNTRYWQVCVIH